MIMRLLWKDVTSPETLTLTIYLLGAQAWIPTISDQWWRHPWWSFENPFLDRHWHLCVVSSSVKDMSIEQSTWTREWLGPRGSMLVIVWRESHDRHATNIIQSSSCLVSLNFWTAYSPGADVNWSRCSRIDMLKWTLWIIQGMISKVRRVTHGS